MLSRLSLGFAVLVLAFTPLAAAVPPAFEADDVVLVADGTDEGIFWYRGATFMGAIPTDGRYLAASIEDAVFTPAGNLVVLGSAPSAIGQDDFIDVFANDGAFLSRVLLPHPEVSMDSDENGDLWMSYNGALDHYSGLTGVLLETFPVPSTGPIAMSDDAQTVFYVAFNHVGKMTVPGGATVDLGPVSGMYGFEIENQESSGNLLVATPNGIGVHDMTGHVVGLVPTMGWSIATMSDDASFVTQKDDHAAQGYAIATLTPTLTYAGPATGVVQAVAVYRNAAPATPPPTPELASVLLVAAGLATVAGIVLRRR